MNNKFDRTEEPCERKIDNAEQFNDIGPFKDYRMALPVYYRPKVEHTAPPDFQIVDAAADLQIKRQIQVHSDGNSYGTKPPDDGPPNSKNGFSDKFHFSTKDVNSEVRLHHDGKSAELGRPEVMLRTSNGEYQFYSGKKEIWHGKIEEDQWKDWK